tara:strand:- start:10138 stop:11250 length:1113 start_codon:yes stop_codon:yes gene_type:complete
MKKILYFIHYPPPIHGVSTINKYIYNSKIINKDFQKKIIKINYNRNLGGIDKLNFLKIFIYFKLLYRFIKNIIFFKPDIVYYSIPPTGFGLYKDIPFVLLLKFFSIRPLFHLHGKGIYKNTNKSFFYKKIHNYIYSNSDIIHLSKGLIDKEIKSLALYNSKFFVVNNGIKKINIKKNFKENDCIDLLFLSNLFVSKGILFGLDVFAKLLKENNNLKFHIVGAIPDNKTKKKILEKIKSKKITDNIILYGAKYGKEKFDIIKKMDLLFYPTFNDAYPLVLLECLQIGIPVVASNQGAIPEIINKNTGFIFKTGQLEDALICILKVIKNLESKDNYYYEQCKNSFNSKFTLDIFEENMNKVVNKVANNICVE